ncbi:TDT family transporter [Rhodobacteraceae bacterium RKSG542]|uniref:TDT family transporter n=1 Tax=Pseudovibrio flavus TaxID=2529854 RepID=UPI0012BBFF42|nr:TDT family transporter [Pseudovibrio flavus]MTI15707.1 TDT family transporter [Pseudovibrio flavus]
MHSSIQKLAGVPTPMAGLALGIASLGWSLENALPLNGAGQTIGALIASVLLLVLAVKFVSHPKLLMDDLQHPVVGSVAPTFAMATMVISAALARYMPVTGQVLWLAAIAVHMVFLGAFVFHRAKKFAWTHMVPSWFVPPIGIIVADVSFPGGAALEPLALVLLYFGMAAYAIMLPLMLYRVTFHLKIPNASKPTLAIFAAPASLSLAGYLTVVQEPSPLIIALLGGIAVLMTVFIYLSMIRLLQLPFSPGYAAFTFPLVISATALFKVCAWMSEFGFDAHYVAQLRVLANIELAIATAVVTYVAIRYAQFFAAKWATTRATVHSA